MAICKPSQCLCFVLFVQASRHPQAIISIFIATAWLSWEITKRKVHIQIFNSLMIIRTIFHTMFFVALLDTAQQPAQSLPRQFVIEKFQSFFDRDKASVFSFPCTAVHYLKPVSYNKPLFCSEWPQVGFCIFNMRVTVSSIY